MNPVQLHDLRFELYISPEKIQDLVADMARRIDHDYQQLNPVLLPVLNGAFIFAADLVRKLTIPIELDFIKIKSYKGTASTGQMNEQLRWQIPLKGRHVLIIEDIVDTGHTLHYIREIILAEEPASVEIASLLFKPDAYGYAEPVKYYGMAIPNDFVVGYGLDYNELGRDLDCICRKVDE
jgi:hypoxanthine phosphoribosyltransferase